MKTQKEELAKWLKTQTKNINDVRNATSELPPGKPIIFYDNLYTLASNVYGLALYKIDKKTSDMGGYGKFLITDFYINKAILLSKEFELSIVLSLKIIVHLGVTEAHKEILEEFFR